MAGPDEVTAVQQGATARYDAVRKQAGTRRELEQSLARAYREATAGMARLRADAAETVDRDLAGVRRRLFGTVESPTDVIGWRDALDRAERVTSEREGLLLMARAGTVGDRQLERAALYVALQRGWRNAASEFAEEYPDLAPDVNTYVEATSVSPSARRADNLREQIATTVPKPAELRDWDDFKIDAAAKGEA